MPRCEILDRVERVGAESVRESFLPQAVDASPDKSLESVPAPVGIPFGLIGGLGRPLRLFGLEKRSAAQQERRDVGASVEIVGAHQHRGAGEELIGRDTGAHSAETATCLLASTYTWTYT